MIRINSVSSKGTADGLPLSEATETVQRFRDLNPMVLAFVTASVDATATAHRRQRRLLTGVIGILSVLTIANGIGAWLLLRTAHRRSAKATC